MHKYIIVLAPILISCFILGMEKEKLTFYQLAQKAGTNLQIIIEKEPVDGKLHANKKEKYIYDWYQKYRILKQEIFSQSYTSRLMPFADCTPEYIKEQLNMQLHEFHGELKAEYHIIEEQNCMAIALGNLTIKKNNCCLLH